MTGKYSFRNYEGDGGLPMGEKTFGHALQKAGYNTAICANDNWVVSMKTSLASAGMNRRFVMASSLKTPYHSHCSASELEIIYFTYFHQKHPSTINISTTILQNLST